MIKHQKYNNDNLYILILILITFTLRIFKLNYPIINLELVQ